MSSARSLQNLQQPCSVYSCTHRHSWQHTGGLGGQAGLHSPSDIGSYQLGTGKGFDSEDGSGGVSCPLLTRPALGHTSHSDWSDQCAGTLKIWLDQKPVHHCCSAENRSLSTSGQLPSPYWTTTVSSVSTLRWRRRDGAASSTLLPVAHAGTIIHQLHQLN